MAAVATQRNLINLFAGSALFHFSPRFWLRLLFWVVCFVCFCDCSPRVVRAYFFISCITFFVFGLLSCSFFSTAFFVCFVSRAVLVFCFCFFLLVLLCLFRVCFFFSFSFVSRSDLLCFKSYFLLCCFLFVRE